MRLWLLLVLTVVSAGAARADEDRDFRARQLYELGRKAYTDGDFQTAYDSFKNSYSLSHKPGLLYNVASALQQLKRPHDAAETLRSYLRLRPDDSERAQIEERIKALEEEQRLVDIDRGRQTPSPEHAPQATPETPVLTTPSTETPASATPAVATAAAADNARARRRKRNITIAVTVGSIAVVGLGVGLGLGLGLQGSTEALTRSAAGPIKATN
jgi:tetratricopeptide (TPR) repeat protein